MRLTVVIGIIVGTVVRAAAAAMGVAIGLPMSPMLHPIYVKDYRPCEYHSLGNPYRTFTVNVRDDEKCPASADPSQNGSYQ